MVEEGARSRTLWLPPGRWYGLYDDVACEGPGEVRLEAPLDRIPVLVRAGAVVPLREDGETVLHVWPPGDGPGGGLRYDDAGDGDGPWSEERYHLTAEAGRLLLARRVKGELEAARPRCVVHGSGPKEVEWTSV